MSEPLAVPPDIADDAVQALLSRAARNCLIFGFGGVIPLWIGSNWRDASMLIVGALISAASIWEWKRLAQLIQAKLSRQQTPRSAPVAVVFFLFRLVVFGAVIYGSLRYLQGSVIALLCGLGLAALAVGWEAFRLLAD